MLAEAMGMRRVALAHMLSNESAGAAMGLKWGAVLRPRACSGSYQRVFFFDAARFLTLMASTSAGSKGKKLL